MTAVFAIIMAILTVQLAVVLFWWFFCRRNREYYQVHGRPEDRPAAGPGHPAPGTRRPRPPGIDGRWIRYAPAPWAIAADLAPDRTVGALAAELDCPLDVLLVCMADWPAVPPRRRRGAAFPTWDSAN